MGADPATTASRFRCLYLGGPGELQDIANFESRPVTFAANVRRIHVGNAGNLLFIQAHDIGEDANNALVRRQDRQPHLDG